MTKKPLILHGDILYTKEKDCFEVMEQGYIVSEEGRVSGVYRTLPEKYQKLPVKDYGHGLIIPAFSDLHVHASQYTQRGIGMDCLLADWLTNYTFPQEANFRDMDYAKPVYDAFTDDLLRNGTFQACCFTTVHEASAAYLAEAMEAKKLYGLVGKVNMTANAPSYIQESVGSSLKDTEKFVEKVNGLSRVKPMLVPRFAPSVTEDLLTGLGKIGKRYGVGLHTHLVESKWEAAEALRLFPKSGSDAEIYEQAGLLGNGPTVFAHYIFPTEEDLRTAKKYDATVVHCPDATANIIAGIAPVKKVLDEGIPFAMGTDIGSGADARLYRQISRAVQLSKLKEFYEPGESGTLTLSEAFYMATKAGGKVFGDFGSFEKNYHMNAIVIDGLEDAGHLMSPEKRLERFCYAGDDRNIVGRYIDGEKL